MNSNTKIKRYRRYLRFRNIFLSYLQNSLLKIKSFDQIFVIIVALIIGIVSGFGAAGFRMLIDFFRSISWGSGNFIDTIQSTPLYLKVTIPIIGIIIVSYIVNQFAPEAKGHGVPEVIDAIATKNGFIRMRVVLVKAVTSAISIGTGAAVGREGPIVQIGSAFGSSVGQVLQVSSRRINTFIACGAAAGIAATFNAPIAGAIFASEVIIRDFSAVTISPIIISSVFGTVISRSIYGDFPAFTPPVYTLHSPYEIINYIFLGIFAGLSGWIFVKTLYFTEDLFDKSQFKIGIKSAIGGGMLGIMAMFLPETLGVGYSSMDAVLSGNLPYLLITCLFFGKIIATSISLGSGASGGVFAPSLFLGSMMGGLMGHVFNILNPGMTASAGAYALVGMAAMVAATTHAPITAILIIFEMTSEYTIILPLMVSSIIAMIISTRLLNGGNIYTIKLLRRGVNVHGSTDVNILDQLSVLKIKQQLVDIINENMELEPFLEKMSQSTQPVFYVCDSNHKLTGAITTGMVRNFLNHMNKIPVDCVIRDIYNSNYPRIKDESPIYEVLRLMLESDILSIPIVDKDEKLTGQVLRQDILREYQDLLIQTQSVGHLASSLNFVHKYAHEKMEVIPGFLMARISSPSIFINQSIQSLKIRKNYHLDVLLIRKAIQDDFEDAMPEPHTKISKNDQLIIFGEKKHIEAICELH